MKTLIKSDDLYIQINSVPLISFHFVIIPEHRGGFQIPIPKVVSFSPEFLQSKSNKL